MFWDFGSDVVQSTVECETKASKSAAGSSLGSRDVNGNARWTSTATVLQPDGASRQATEEW